MANRAASSFAAAVSSTLRGKGIQTLPSEASRMREGVRVNASGLREARISVDLDSESAALRLAADVYLALFDSGYTVRRNPGDETILYATRES